MLTNIYASISGGGIGIGHQWHNVTVPELVRWTTEFGMEHWMGSQAPSSRDGISTIHATTV